MVRPDPDDRLSPSRITEGDEVIMKINAHDWKHTGSLLEGKVIDAPDKRTREFWRDGNRPMVDVAVEGKIINDRREGDEWPTDTVVWRYHVDNGYVTGPIDKPNRPSRSDIGRISGFYDPSTV